MAQLAKTVQGLAIASVKTLQGLAIASAKTIMGVDNQGGILASFSDNFSGTLAAWTIETGTFDINAGQLRATTGGFVDNVIVYTTPINTLSGYIKATRGDDATFPKMVFRYTNSASPFYALEINSSVVQWFRYASLGGAGTQIGSNGTLASGIGTAIGLTFTGIGNATVLNVWLNPTGAAPTTSSLWGGAAPTVAYTNDPPSPVDSGGLVGLGGSQSAANTLKWDDFSGGDVP